MTNCARQKRLTFTLSCDVFLSIEVAGSAWKVARAWNPFTLVAFVSLSLNLYSGTRRANSERKRIRSLSARIRYAQCTARGVTVRAERR